MKYIDVDIAEHRGSEEDRGSPAKNTEFQPLSVVSVTV